MPASMSFAGPRGPRPRRSGIAFQLRSNVIAYHKAERLSRALRRALACGAARWMGIDSRRLGTADRSPRRVRVFSVAIIATVPYSIEVSKLRPVPSAAGLRRPFLSDFFIAASLLRRREQFTAPHFAPLARALNLVDMDPSVHPNQRELSSPPRKRGSTSVK